MILIFGAKGTNYWFAHADDGDSGSPSETESEHNILNGESNERLSMDPALWQGLYTDEQCQPASSKRSATTDPSGPENPTGTPWNSVRQEIVFLLFLFGVLKLLPFETFAF